jgi:MarR family transcriptional regulator, organic hydroperoxide resistance regulator
MDGAAAKIPRRASMAVRRRTCFDGVPEDPVTTRSGTRKPASTPRPRDPARDRDAAEVVKALRQLFKAIQEYSKAMLRKTGLSGPQLWALTVLEAHPGLSLNELSERLFAHPSTVSGIVDRLAERGVLSRTADPVDRRGIRLSLMPRGRTLLRKSPPPVQIGLRRALEDMPAAQLRQFRRSLEAVVRGTAARGVDAAFFDVVSPPRRR